MLNPFRYRSKRATRITFSVLALIVFAICTMRIFDVMVFRATSNDECGWVTSGAGKPGLIIRDVIRDGVTDRAGVRDGDTLLRINGKEIDIRSAPGVLNALQPGDTATYTLSRNGAHFEARIRILKLFDIFSLSLFLLGCAFLFVGYIVVMTKPEGVVQRSFAWYGIASLLIFGLFTLNLDPADPAWKRLLLLSGFMAGRILGAPQMILFFRLFPERNQRLSSKWIRPVLIFVSLAFVLLLLFSARLGISISTIVFILVSPITFFLTGIGFFIGSYFRIDDAKKRSQFRPILLSVLLTIVVFGYIAVSTTVSPFFFFLQPMAVLPVVLVLLLPIAFGYSIFRYRLMDIDLIVERSLIYGAVTTSLAAIYIVVVFGIGSVLGFLIGKPDSKILMTVAFVVIAFVFDPIKRRVQESIDRTFYRERRDYQKALLEFSQELPRLINREEILDSILNRISSTMHVEKLAVILPGENGAATAAAKNIPEDLLRFAPSPGGVIEHLRATRAAQSLTFVGDDVEALTINDDDRRRIAAAGIVLAVPMLIQERLIGVISVGPKLSGKVYSQDDIDLLSTVASQAAIAVENSRLHRSEIEKEKIKEELAMARRIQQGLLPKSDPAIAHLDVSGISIPALSVGGDYYDYILLGPKKLLVVVADVSGKGMSAALYMSKIQGMIQLAGRMYATPKEMLVHVNRLLYDGIERKSFITMILGLFDLEKKTASICRAGHNRAIIAAGNDVAFLRSSGIGLGLERGEVFEKTLEQVEYRLNGDTWFVFYSDGLTEMMNEREQEFGEEALCAIVRERNAAGAAAMREQLIAAANAFRGSADQHDDMTTVVVRAF